MVHRHDCQHNQSGPHQQSGEHKIFLAICQSILNIVFIHIFSLSLFLKKKEVQPREKITEFPLWRPVPPGRGVAKDLY